MAATKKPQGKVFDTPTLKSLCDNAERLKFENEPNREFWKEADPKGEHVVMFAMRYPQMLPLGRLVKHP